MKKSHTEFNMKQHGNLNIQVPKGTQITVVGDVHGHSEQFFKMIEKVKPGPENWFVSVGDIIDKGTIEGENLVIDAMIEMRNAGYGFVVRGNHELKRIRKMKKSDTLCDRMRWFDQQPLALSFVFDNGTRLTVLHGGVAPQMDWSHLINDVSICYIRDLDDKGKPIKLSWVNGSLVADKEGGKVWHLSYSGSPYGYIASGHNANFDGTAKFYDFSCNLDSCVYQTGIFSAQSFSKDGLGKCYTTTGEASSWKA